jgi:hypothetical protein
LVCFGGLRRKQARIGVAFAAGAVVTIVAGVAAAAVAFGPGLVGG